MTATGAASLWLAGCGGGDGAGAPGAQARSVARELIAPRLLTVGKQQIAVYESGGSGPAVMLIHGNSSSAKIWQQTLGGELGRKYRLVAIDLPGHGASSDAAPEDRTAVYSIPGYAAVIRGVASQLSIENGVFVGWSLGGHAVMEASTQLGEAAGFMVFGAPPLPFPPAPDFGGAFLSASPLAFQKDLTLEEAREFVSTFLSPGAAVPDFLVDDALRTDGNARATVVTVPFSDEIVITSNMRQPFAILQGAREQIVNLAYLEKLAPSLPTLSQDHVELVADAGHALQWEQPARFDAQLDAFVTAVQAKPSTVVPSGEAAPS